MTVFWIQEKFKLKWRNTHTSESSFKNSSKSTFLSSKSVGKTTADCRFDKKHHRFFANLTYRTSNLFRERLWKYSDEWVSRITMFYVCLAAQGVHHFESFTIIVWAPKMLMLQKMNIVNLDPHLTCPTYILRNIFLDLYRSDISRPCLFSWFYIFKACDQKSSMQHYNVINLQW